MIAVRCVAGILIVVGAVLVLGVGWSSPHGSYVKLIDDHWRRVVIEKAIVDTLAGR